MESTNVAAVPRTERSGHGAHSANLAKRGAAADAGASFGALLGTLSCDADAVPDTALVLPDAGTLQELPTAAAAVAADIASAPAEVAQALLPGAALTDGTVGADASSSAARMTALLQSPAAMSPVAMSPVAESGRGLPAGMAARVGDSGARRDGAMATLRATDRPDSTPQPATLLASAEVSDQTMRSVARDTTAAEAAQHGARVSAALSRRMEQQLQREAAVAKPASTHGEAESVVANAATLLLDGLGGGAKILVSGREPERKTQVTGGLTGPAWSDAPPPGNVALASPSYVLDAGATAPEVTVAEQVHYWVTKGVQSAELQLDAFGGGQVDVHVSVVGNEAQVEFRTDQPEARRLLQDAMPQLRHMLEQEGMLLSGGFVGTSARQDSGPNGRQPARTPEGVKTPASVALPVSGQTVGPRGSGRTLDVFV